MTSGRSDYVFVHSSADCRFPTPYSRFKIHEPGQSHVDFDIHQTVILRSAGSAAAAATKNLAPTSQRQRFFAPSGRSK
jgi:hypothetical protein